MYSRNGNSTKCLFVVFEYFSGCSLSGTLPPGYIDKEQFICDQCPNVYFNKISLRAHLRSSHSGKIRPKIPRERKCPHCEKTFLQAASYQEHIKVQILCFKFSSLNPLIFSLMRESWHKNDKSLIPCPSLGLKWFWTVQINLFWSGPIHFGQVQIRLFWTNFYNLHLS